MFRALGAELITPPMNSFKTLEIGSALSPGEMCLPFKLMLGNLIGAWERGADTVLFPATMGPCRLGMYGELLKRILEREGYSYKWILLDSPQAIGWLEFMRRLRQVPDAAACSVPEMMRALQLTFGILFDFEQLHQSYGLLCGDAKLSASAERNDREAETAIKSDENLHEIKACLEKRKKEMQRLRKMKNESVRTEREITLLVTGEIFSCVEPFANHQIEQQLQKEKVSYLLTPDIRWWMHKTFHLPYFGRESDASGEKRSRHDIGGLPCEVGGYARDTVRLGQNAKKMGFDGVIQLFPAGCMPEIVAKSVFDAESTSIGVPVLSLIFDEMGGEAGYITRVEAFVDLIRRQKQAKRKRDRG